MRNCFSVCSIFLLFIFVYPLHANTTNPDSLQKFACECPRNLIVHTWHDGWRIAAAPLKWRTTEWLRVIALMGVGGLLYSSEVEMDRYWQEHRSAGLATSAKIVRQFGNKFVLFPAFGTFYLAGYLGDHPRICRLGTSGIRSLVVTSLLTAGLKFLAQREGTDDHDLWHGPVIPFQGESFPSGHATLAFVTATVLAHEFEYSRMQKVAVYSLATATAWSRVYDQKHWVTDVFAGTMIGHFTTKALLNFENSARASVRLEPFFSGNVAGIVCRF